MSEPSSRKISMPFQVLLPRNRKPTPLLCGAGTSLLMLATRFVTSVAVTIALSLLSPPPSGAWASWSKMVTPTAFAAMSSLLITVLSMC